MRKFLLSIAAALSLLSASAQNGLDNPITRAVLDVYEKQLKANPDDYMTWFKRANEYYRHNEYIRSLADVNEALRSTPAKDSDMRFQEFMLRAGIYSETGRLQQALADYNSALVLDPDNFTATYLRANTEFELGMYPEAKTDYLRMQRLNQRSPEALLGLARVAVKENNLGLANDYLDKAVNLDVNNPELYIRRSTVKSLMGDHNSAVDDLLLALSIDSSNTKALDMLVKYGNKNYAATMTGLTNAIRQAPETGMYRYIRAVIEQAHFNYLAAIADYEYLINNGLYNYYGINASVAECLFYLGRFDKALEDIDHVLAMPGASNVASNYVLRSRILRTLNRDNEAVEAAAKALAIAPNSAESMAQMGLAYLDAGNTKEALNLFGEASLTEADRPYYYMLRAWVQNDYLNNPATAQSLYEQALDLHDYQLDNIESLRGFALLYTDRKPQAEAWLNNILTTVPDPDGRIHYLAACFYAQAGDDDRALECTEEALKAGYANLYDWMHNTDARINVAPIRDHLKFLQLINRYTGLFN